MQKLAQSRLVQIRLTGLVLLLGASPAAQQQLFAASVGQLTAEATAATGTAKPQLIKDLLAVVAKGPLTPDQAASLMLSAGPAGTAEAFRWLDSAKLDHASLPPVQRERLEPALQGTPKLIIRAALVPDLGAAEQHHTFSVAFEAIAGLGGRASIAQLEMLLRGASASAVAPSLRSQTTRAVAQLATEPELQALEVGAWLKAAGPQLATSVVDGLSEAKAVMILVECLHQTTGAEGAILNRASGLIQRGEPVKPDAAAQASVPFLASENAFERAEASTIIGLVGDRRHVEKLIGGLGDTQHMVRTNALKALKNLTGMTISGDVNRWQQWYEGQEAWWESKGASVVDALGSAHRNELVSLLKQVSTRRLYRREITEKLLPMLSRSRADEVRVVVASLATLRDPACLEAIIELRRHDDPRVRATVADALVAFRHSGIKASRVKVLPGH